MQFSKRKTKIQINTHLMTLSYHRMLDILDLNLLMPANEKKKQITKK